MKQERQSYFAVIRFDVETDQKKLMDVYPDRGQAANNFFELQSENEYTYYIVRGWRQIYKKLDKRVPLMQIKMMRDRHIK